MVKMYGERTTSANTKKKFTGKKKFPAQKKMMNQHAKDILNKDIENTLIKIASPMEPNKEIVSIRTFDNKTQIYESITLDIIIAYKGDQTSFTVGRNQLKQFFDYGYQLVAFHADKNLGQVITLHKMPEGKKK